MINGNRTKSNRGRSPRDLYITPIELAEAAVLQLQKDGEFDEYWNVLDAGCGTGVWGKAINRACFTIDGIDIEPNVGENAHYYDQVFTRDYLKYRPDGYGYGLILGNPPYSLAEEFIRHSFDLLTYNGRIFFLLRLSFLEGIGRCKGLFKEFPLKRVYVCSRRPSFFSSDGKHHTTDTLAYAMFLWQKDYFDMGSDLNFLDWNY